MKKKIIIEIEQMQNPMFEKLLEQGCLRLLGVFWKKEVHYYRDITNGNWVFTYV